MTRTLAPIDREVSTLHRACTFTRDAVFYGNGSMTTLRAGLHTDLPAILAGTLGRFTPHATIVIDGASVAELARHDNQVRAAGWQFTRRDPKPGERPNPWTLYHRDDGRTVAVGCRDAMGPRQFGVLFAGDTDAGTLALLLDRYNALIPAAWRGTAATTALAAIRLSWENSRSLPRWNVSKIGPGYATGPLIWSRPLNANESWWGWVHTFDASSAYLGAAGNAELAWSTLDHTGPRTFAKHLPGYWHVRLAPSTLALCHDPERPPVITPARIRDGAAWLTTPLAQLLAELGDPLDVVDSWTAAKHGQTSYRVLRAWGEQLRDARLKAGNGPLEYAIKRTYKDATGGMQRAGMRVHRPDWAHTLIDLWRATVYRRILRVHEHQGVWPVAVKTDSLSYADSFPAPMPRHATRPWETLTDSLTVTSCELDCGCSPDKRTALGTYRHEATVSTADWLTATQRPEKLAGVAR